VALVAIIAAAAATIAVMPRPAVSLVAAVARDGGIGHAGGLLVRLPDDLPRFKRITMGAPIVMGRKTWASIGRALPGRRNIVVTRDPGFRAEGAEVASSLDDALEQAASAGKVYVIGGAQIYALALPIADVLLLTEIDAEFTADTFFPPGTGAASSELRTNRTRAPTACATRSPSTRDCLRETDMSEHGFHVHGPHDHALEHEGQAEPHGMAGHLVVATAIIATVGAMFAYMGGLTQANAGLYKNESAIKKTEAADQWSYYQAKSSKQNLAELAVELAPEARRAFYADEVKRYKSEKEEVKKNAEKIEHESDEWGRRSEEQIHEHHRWAQATTALQVSIALAAIALLTKSRRLQYGVYALSAIGVAVGVLAWLHI
jgi:dihydrofolate reductase